MLIVMPCRSEKTRQGMARYGHLADGRLKLVLVKRCNAYQYLRFLMSMSATGGWVAKGRVGRGQGAAGVVMPHGV